MSFRHAPLSGLRPIPILWILPSLLWGSGPCKDSGTGVFYSHYLLHFGSQVTNRFWGGLREKAAPGVKGGGGCSGSEVQRNQLLGILQARQRGTGLKLHLLKRKPNRTSSLTGLANGILFHTVTHSRCCPLQGFWRNYSGKDPTSGRPGEPRGAGTSATGVPFLSHTHGASLLPQLSVG